MQWPAGYWNIDHESKTAQLLGCTLQERNYRMAETLQRSRERSHIEVLKGWRNELFPVFDEQREVVVDIERAGSALFGIVVYGVGMTGYVTIGNDDTRLEDGLRIWVARRSPSKPTYPNMLDNTVVGGIASGDQVFETLVREAEEEASIPAAYVHRHAVASGMVTYFDIRDSRAGGEPGLLQPECIFVYDLPLKPDMVLTPGDNEAEAFMLWSVPQVWQALAAGQFKCNCALVMLDFFIRHGFLAPDRESDYIEILARLHRKTEFPTR